jgi:hypothetical protein
MDGVKLAELYITKKQWRSEDSCLLYDRDRLRGRLIHTAQICSPTDPLLSLHVVILFYSLKYVVYW